jgi:hypothetical protein
VRTIVCGCFVVFGVAIVIAGLTMEPPSSGEASGGPLLAGMGALLVLLFGFVCVQGIRTMRSTGLRLTVDGFQLNNATYAWSDVEDFRVVGDGDGDTHVRVGFTSDAAKHSRTVRVSVTLGRLRYYTTPAYLSLTSFDTGGVRLVHILRSWQHGHRSVGPPARPSVADDVTTVARRRRGPDDLVIPAKRDGRLFNTGMAVFFFVVITFGLPIGILSGAKTPQLWLLIAVGVLWAMLSAITGYVAFDRLRNLRSARLIVHDNGFEFGGQKWAWADIEYVRLAELPFDRDDFSDDGPPVDQILRDRLQRYRYRQDDSL